MVIKSIMDISPEMNSMEAKLELNENVCCKSFCRLEYWMVKCSNENLQFSSVDWENWNKLEVISLHNLKAKMQCYALTQYVWL